jgi:hypothetical protein
MALKRTNCPQNGRRIPRPVAALAGGALGGLIGSIAGPLGVIAGAALGATLGFGPR